MSEEKGCARCEALEGDLRVMTASREYWRRGWHELNSAESKATAERARLRADLTVARDDLEQTREEVQRLGALVGFRCEERDKARQALHDAARVREQELRDLSQRKREAEEGWQRAWRTMHNVSEGHAAALAREEEAHKATRRELEALREACDLCRVCGSELSRSERAEETSCDEHPGRLCFGCACPDCPPADAGGDDQGEDEHEP